HNLKGVAPGAACPKCGTSTATVPPLRRPLTREEKHGIAAIFIMAFFVFFFWLCFEQAGSSMNLFAEERTDRSLTPSLAQSIYDWGTKPGYPAPWWVFTISGLA